MDHNKKTKSNKSSYDRDHKIGGIDSIPSDDFECERPFIFIIHEQKHNVILFIGKFMKPEKWTKRLTEEDLLADSNMDSSFENNN